MAYKPPALVDVVPGNLGLERGIPRSSAVRRGANVFVEVPDCDTSLYTDGPSVIFPQTPGMWGCVPGGAIPHPSYMMRFDGLTAAAAGDTLPEIANDPPKTMTVSTAATLPTFNQSIAGWTKRAARFTEVSGQGLHIPFDANGNWFDVGRQDVAVLLWIFVVSSGGNRPVWSFSGTGAQARVTSTGLLNLFTAGGSVSGTFDYRNATPTVHPILLGYRLSIGEFKAWTDKEVITGSFSSVSDLEKGMRVSGQAPPVYGSLGFDVWIGDAATTICTLNQSVFTRLGFIVT